MGNCDPACEHEASCVSKANTTAGLVEDVTQRDGKMLKAAKAKAKGRLSDPASAFVHPKEKFGACR